MSWCLVSYCNIDIGIPIYLHDPPCVLHHVFGKKTPHDLGPSSSKRTIRMPECCASAKNGGSPTHLSSTPHLWATKKFGFRKLLFCIVESAWIAQKRIVGLTMVSKSIVFYVVIQFFGDIPKSLSIQLFKVRSYGYSHDLDLGTFREALGKTHGDHWVSYPRVGSPINVAADTRTSDHLAA